MVDGSEGFWQEPNNVAVRLMASVFGPMPGTYHGPYPTKEEVRALLRENPRRVEMKEVGLELVALGLPPERHSGFPCTRGVPPEAEWAVLDYRGETIIVATENWAVLLERARGRTYAEYHGLE